MRLLMLEQAGTHADPFFLILKVLEFDLFFEVFTYFGNQKTYLLEIYANFFKGTHGGLPLC